MSCILTFSGITLDINKLVFESGLKPFNKWNKGEPLYRSKPNGKQKDNSGISLETSLSNFDEPAKQIEETITYLESNRESLLIAAEFRGVDHAYLDFGFNSRLNFEKVIVQVDVFPRRLIKISGILGLSIHVSNYSDIFQ